MRYFVMNKIVYCEYTVDINDISRHSKSLLSTHQFQIHSSNFASHSVVNGRTFAAVNMKFVYAFLIVLACFIPVLIGAGFGLEALIAYCGSNSTCSSVEVCMNGKCKDPCDNRKCGQNARCSVHNHTATCECLPSHKGDPAWRCEKKCDHDSECGSHATCHRFNYGVSLCKCQRGYAGDPWHKCQKHCSVDIDCDDNEICNGGKCVDTCLDVLCGKHAVCRASGRNAICSCKNCFRGNPYIECKKKDTADCHVAE